MRKIIKFLIILIFFVLNILIFNTNAYAESLNSIKIDLDKKVVHPGENVEVSIDFGIELNEYNINIAYDKNLFEYVSSVEGVNVTNNGDIITVNYMSDANIKEKIKKVIVIFKAKDIITSNPSDFNVTIQNMRGLDNFIYYDNPLTPTKKEITVEPIFKNYDISLDYTGNIIENEEKDMKLVIKSAMGKNYEKTRIIATAITPNNERAKLLGIDSLGIEHDIIQTGWGSDTGDSIGGKDIVRELNLKGIFSKIGDYSITIRLIDKKNNDSVIASNTFNVTVFPKEQELANEEKNVFLSNEKLLNNVESEENKLDNNVKNEDSNNFLKTEISTLENNNIIINKTNEVGINNIITNKTNENSVNNIKNTIKSINTNEIKDNDKPKSLPKTGSTIYFLFLPIIFILILAYAFFKKKD